MTREHRVGVERKSNSGLFAIMASTFAAAIGYWIISAEETPTLPFALAQYLLLGSVLVATLDSFVNCRAAR